MLLLDQAKVLPEITVPSDSRAVAVNRCVSPSSIDAEDGDTSTRFTTGGGSVTLNVAVPDTPSTVALIVVEPALTPVAVVAVPDDGLTVATEVLLLDQAKVLPIITVPSDSRALAVNRCVSPSSIEVDVGDTVTRFTTGGGSVTVSIAVPDMLSAVAVIITSPAPTPVAKPFSSTMATMSSELDQVNSTSSTDSPSAVAAMASNCCVSPSSIVVSAGLTATVATTGGGSVTVSVAVPETLSPVAVIIA